MLFRLFVCRGDGFFQTFVSKSLENEYAAFHGFMPVFAISPLGAAKYPVDYIAFLDGTSDAETESVEIRGAELLSNGFQAVVPGIASAELEAQ